jgi:nucleotide-binding universal stress UspA family protein
MLGEFMTDMRARHPQVAQLQHVREEVVSGLPETRITELAKNIGAQKIVIGCSGISELRKLWFGSVSGRVERDSEIPVQVINAHSTASDIRSLTR